MCGPYAGAETSRERGPGEPAGGRERGGLRRARAWPPPSLTAPDRWVFKATVYNGSDSKGFVGYGDADPSNVSPLVRGAEMRVAETRAVNRALRKAYGIGLCSVEELGSFSASPNPVPVSLHPNGNTDQLVQATVTPDCGINSAF